MLHRINLKLLQLFVDSQLFPNLVINEGMGKCFNPDNRGSAHACLRESCEIKIDLRFSLLVKPFSWPQYNHSSIGDKKQFTELFVELVDS